MHENVKENINRIYARAAIIKQEILGQQYRIYEYCRRPPIVVYGQIF
ncbi:MAG: hypothetical protein QXY59_05285 [Candidatus Korarchaeota archaeon]